MFVDFKMLTILVTKCSQKIEKKNGYSNQFKFLSSPNYLFQNKQIFIFRRITIFQISRHKYQFLGKMANIIKHTS